MFDCVCCGRDLLASKVLSVAGALDDALLSLPSVGETTDGVFEVTRAGNGSVRTLDVGGLAPLPPRGPCGYLDSGAGRLFGPLLEPLGPDGTSCEVVVDDAGGGGGFSRPG